MMEQEPDFEIVGEAGDGCEMVELCGSLGSALVVIDARTPMMDALSATSGTKRSASRSRLR